MCLRAVEQYHVDNTARFVALSKVSALASGRAARRMEFICVAHWKMLMHLSHATTLQVPDPQNTPPTRRPHRPADYRSPQGNERIGGGYKGRRPTVRWTAEVSYSPLAVRFENFGQLAGYQVCEFERGSGGF